MVVIAKMIKALGIIDIIGHLIRRVTLLIGVLFLWLYPLVYLEPFYGQISSSLFVVASVVQVFILIGSCVGFVYIWDDIICKYIQNKFNIFRDNLINE